MIGWLVLLGLMIGLPILTFAFAPRAFRRFCLCICTPWLAYTMLFPNLGPDNPLIILDAVPLAVVISGALVEIVVFARRLYARRSAYG